MTHPNITPIVMPKWGLSMKEGTLAAWHVEEGQTIVPGQEIMDVETDKIANAVEAPDGGLLRRRIGEVGLVYPVKALLGVMAPAETSDAEIDAFVSDFAVPTAGGGDEDDGPVHHFVHTPSGRLRYAMRPGEGTPTVFVHGFGGDLDNWLFNIDAAAAAGPAYALDLPGHGGSDKAIARPGLAALAEAVAAFMHATGLSDAHLVGHSMGGAVASLVALRGDGLVRALTLISPAGLGAEINAGYIDGFVAAESRRELKPVLKDLFADENLVSRQMIDDLLKYKRLDGVPSALRGLASAMFAGGRQTTVLTDRLAALSIPIQVIWGARDAVIPATHAKALPHAKVEIVETAGHMAMMEAAGRVNDLIRMQTQGAA
ncbi:acetoin dehydrogenase dihydrolipoyllysine-residue acetyltransferase subunit [Phreatobacter sp. AB_2022a]|uniref:acetoin dehydrogenase dihydrolipoyllysine-residue acetyltransferase subunit n=1 Tax=Phreatobacter sp. AB_2022a TaxID=3003134 RepID=UPI002287078F|nr:acetoin dehydrogenase dihydrolipoyllysine-residue acetyltransferase subunit [Phreatobacter sp. AB_2022a]MCZ0734889.1 acetoin dehydrogenase dihydrolipoyllysine-residue acetyltransferase subunit [Phreatobacter sp. AB_2022a]